MSGWFRARVESAGSTRIDSTVLNSHDVLTASVKNSLDAAAVTSRPARPSWSEVDYSSNSL